VRGCWRGTCRGDAYLPPTNPAMCRGPRVWRKGLGRADIGVLRWGGGGLVGRGPHGGAGRPCVGTLCESEMTEDGSGGCC